MSNQTTILYPIFDTCKNYTLDQHWKDIFYDCARGKFPSGCKYIPHQNTICIYKNLTNKKSEHISLPEDPDKLFQSMMKIFKTKLGMTSSKEDQLQNYQLDLSTKPPESEPFTEWKKAKPKYLKEKMILDFVCDHNNLTIKEKKLMLSIIELGIQFKTIDSSDIHIENGRIKSIDHLKFDEEKRTFSIDKERTQSLKQEKTVTSNKFLQNMDKYI